MRIRIIDKGAGKLAEALDEAPISLALKGSILGQLVNQRLLDASGDGVFKTDAAATIVADQYVVGLELGRAGEAFVTALRTFSKDVI
jgi:hypothetical protein